MKRSYLHKGVVASALFLAVLAFQNCAEQKFSQAPESSLVSQAGEIFEPDPSGRIDETDDQTGVITQTGGPNCREFIQTTTAPIRFLAVVDVSGSNVQYKNVGTDPIRAVRSGSIQRFYNTYKAKANFGWGFLTFQGNSAEALIGPSRTSPAFGNASDMNAAIQKFIGIADDDETPYVAALNMARKTIENDLPSAPNTKWVVVFISDGRPSDTDDLSELRNLVNRVTNVSPGNVSFNTVYYGPYDRRGVNATDAVRVLREMAAAGAGNFLDTNANPSGNAFLISDLVTVRGVTCN